jgi:hypothetical protein
MLIAFLENNLNEDGSVNIPVALRPYMGFKEVITPYVRSENHENKDFRNRTVFGLSIIC